MTQKTLAQRMEPVLLRPGMYVGMSSTNLLWYLSGMIDLECLFSDEPAPGYEPLHLFLAKKFGLLDDHTNDYSAIVDKKFSEEEPAESMKVICEATRELLFKIENPHAL